MIPVNVQYNVQLWSTKDAIFGYMDGWHGIRMTTPSSRTNPVDLVNDRFVVVDDSTPHPPLEGSRFVRIVQGYPIKSPRSAWKVSANPEDAELGTMTCRLWSDYASTRTGAGLLATSCHQSSPAKMPNMLLVYRPDMSGIT